MSKYSNLFKVISWGEPSKAQITLIGITTTLSALLSLTIPILIQRTIDGFNSFDSANWLPLLLMLCGWMFSAILGGFGVYLTGKIGIRMLLNLRTKLFKRSVRLPMSYFDSNASTEPSSRIVNDPGVIGDLLNHQIQQVIAGSISMIGSLIILWILDWQLTLIMIVTLVLSVGFMTPLSRRLAKISMEIQQSESTLLNKTMESLSNIRLIKADQSQHWRKAI